MKKLFILLISTVVSITFVNAQTVDEIFDNFNSKTKLSTIDKAKSQSMSMQMTVEAQGTKMPISIIKGGADKIRIEMSAAGQFVVMVLNGTDAFAIVPGQGVQDMPAAMVKEQTKQMEIVEMFKFDKEKNIFTFKGAEGGQYVIEEAKIKNPKKITATYFFNKETGLLEKINSRQEGMNATTVLSQYKDYNGLNIPSVFDIEAAGQKVKMTIEALDFNAPVLPYMFARPN